MAEMILAQSWLVLMFPLCGFVVIGLWLGSAYREAAGRFAVAMAALTLCSSLAVAASYGATVPARPDLYPGLALVAARVGWLNFAPGLTADLGILLDPISVMMLVVISSILFFVTVYSVGYMREDAGFGRFFALLDLFGLAMLGLVLSSNILQMFVFWELVGFASYALIGFWYEKPSAVAASKKAFVVTRFADAFFLLGLIGAGFFAGGFDFALLNRPSRPSFRSTSGCPTPWRAPPRSPPSSTPPPWWWPGSTSPPACSHSLPPPASPCR